MHKNIWKLAKVERDLTTQNIIKKQNKSIRNYKNNLLLELKERNPKKVNDDVIALNLTVTEKSIDRILKNSNLSLLERVLISNHILELYGREIYLEDGKVFKNLSVAKSNGFFFTPSIISNKLLEASKNIKTKKVSACDPASGGGVLLAMLLMSDIKVDKVYGFEKDEFACHISKKILKKVKDELSLNTEIKITNTDSTSILFNSKYDEKFDFIISNPPYGRIKHLSDSLTNNETKVGVSKKEMEKLNEKLTLQNKDLSKKLKSKLSLYGLDSGTVELSKVFWGIALKIAKNGGVISYITPNSWLGDKTSTKFRSEVFKNHKLVKVINIRENANFFQTVNQPTVITHIIKNSDTEVVEFVGPVSNEADLESTPTTLNLKDLLETDCDLQRIPFKCVDAYSLFEKLSSYTRVKNLEDVYNLRGECDLTFFKECIKTKKAKKDSRLIRGDHIEAFKIKHYSREDKSGFIDFKMFREKLGDSPKLEHVVSQRMVCPQCSYLDKKNRLYWAVTQTGDVVANSANYLYFDEELDGPLFTSLMISLNSTPVEWFFRYFNSNNHIGNFEINELPVFLLDKKDLSKSKKLISQISNSKNGLSDTNQAKIDELARKYFGLSNEELLYMKESVIDDQTRFNAEKESSLTVPNHIKTRLSELDMKMVVSIPQGGNWTSIPESVQSKRVEQIREMSKERGLVRTSYYGRLRPEQPSYTISTYYNRPGNGTNIHPWENRTITSREAARLQSFPDSFIFNGPEGAIRNQIGNAVPPLLGFSVGSSVREVVKSKTCVDLFCGAGGLSLGFQNAGFDIVSSLDNDKYAIQTHKLNLPNENTVCGDITDEEVLDNFVARTKQVLKGKKLGALVGGPPCQGFSTAGWRKHDDKRNGLVSYFLRAVESLDPECVVIENVEGLLNMAKGQVVKDIIDTLIEMGYDVNDPWLLRAEQFGVPQMRRRAFITAVKTGRQLPTMPVPFLDICKGRREKPEDRSTGKYPITVKEAISDLPNIEEFAIESDNCEFDRGYFHDYCKGVITPDDLVNGLS